MAKLQAVPGDENTARMAERIFGVLAQDEKTAERIGVTAAQFLRRASNWEQIRDYIAPALKAVKRFNGEGLDNLEAAFNEREHVRTSWHLADIRALLENNGRHVPDGDTGSGLVV